MRPREEPVPLVASWLRGERRRTRIRRIVMWSVGGIVVLVAAFLARDEIVRREGRRAAPVRRPPIVADTLKSRLAGLPETLPAGPVVVKRDSILPIVPPVPPRADSVRASSRPSPAAEALMTRRAEPPPAAEPTVPAAPAPEARRVISPPPVVQESTWVRLTRADTTRAVPSPGVPAVAESDSFTIHISSFQQRSQAETEVERLRGLNVDARVASAFLPGRGMWYRVVVGTYPDSMAAWREAMRLREMGYIAFAQILRNREPKR